MKQIIALLILSTLLLVGCTEQIPSSDRTCEQACTDAGYSNSICHSSNTLFEVHTYIDEGGSETPYDEFIKTPPYRALIKNNSPNYNICGREAYVFVGAKQSTFKKSVGGMNELVEFSDCNNKNNNWNTCCCY